MTSSSEAHTVVKLENVSAAYNRRKGIFAYEKFWALRNVSFDIKHGETLGIIGKNGAGKSSLLRLLGGIAAPNEGTIIFEKGIKASLLSLQGGFMPYLTGRENAVLGGMLMGHTKSRMQELLPKIETLCSIGEFFDQPVMQYSTGMTARLGFSVAIHTDPEIILIDEVLGVGDAEFRSKSEKILRGVICADKTVVLVSHNPNTIKDLCDRVIVLDNGKIASNAVPDEALSTYQLSIRAN